jgi:uncharacterized membrane protein YccC
MKRDPHISKLIRESGVVSAPLNFTASVMDRIEAIPAKSPYKPLIGKGGRILTILFVIAVLVTALFSTDPSGELFGTTIQLPQIERQLPQFSFNLEFMSQINISAGVVAALVAIFVLVLTDAGLNKRRLIQ